MIYNQGRPLDVVIPQLMDELVGSRDRYDALAEKLRGMTADASPKVRKDLETYIDGQRNIATGCMEFWYVRI